LMGSPQPLQSPFDVVGRRAGFSSVEGREGVRVRSVLRDGMGDRRPP
jgi:hypothetical protein